MGDYRPKVYCLAFNIRSLLLLNSQNKVQAANNKKKKTVKKNHQIANEICRLNSCLCKFGKENEKNHYISIEHLRNKIKVKYQMEGGWKWMSFIMLLN